MILVVGIIIAFHMLYSAGSVGVPGFFETVLGVIVEFLLLWGAAEIILVFLDIEKIRGNSKAGSDY